MVSFPYQDDLVLQVFFDWWHQDEVESLECRVGQFEHQRQQFGQQEKGVVQSRGPGDPADTTLFIAFSPQ